MTFPIAILFMDEIPQGQTAGSFSALANYSKCSIRTSTRWDCDALYRHAVLSDSAATVLGPYFGVELGANSIIVDCAEINSLMMIKVSEHLQKIVWVKDIKTADFLLNLSNWLSQEELIDTPLNIFYSVAEVHGLVSLEEATAREDGMGNLSHCEKDVQLARDKIDALLSTNAMSI